VQENTTFFSDDLQMITQSADDPSFMVQYGSNYLTAYF